VVSAWRRVPDKGVVPHPYGAFLCERDLAYAPDEFWEEVGRGKAFFEDLPVQAIEYPPGTGAEEVRVFLRRKGDVRVGSI
jgi:hypothetical protein